MMRIRIATRKSPLALWQSEHVAGLLESVHAGLEVELVPLSTRGDELLDRSLAEIGGKGLFLKELERALLDQEADLAVHSLKDVPAESPDGLELVAWLERADPGDLAFVRNGLDLVGLPSGARVGTSSLRRASQLRALRRDLEVVPLRGSVETRLGRLDQGQVDAVLLAAAGIRRLGIRRPDEHPLDPPDWLPAPGQGVITVQARANEVRWKDLVAPLRCRQTEVAVRAERAVVAALGADCRMPLAAHARVEDGRIELRARLGGVDGELVDVILEGPAEDAGDLGREAAQRLLQAGGRRILADSGVGDGG